MALGLNKFLYDAYRERRLIIAQAAADSIRYRLFNRSLIGVTLRHVSAARALLSKQELAMGGERRQKRLKLLSAKTVAVAINKMSSKLSKILMKWA